MLSQRYFRLRSLGQLTFASVVGDTETPTSVRPRHLAVLTVLALSRRTVTRDALLEMFWGGDTEARARHSLSNALSALRGLLGPDAITARHDQVSLEPQARIEVDALQFAAACEVRDDERALGLYAGPLLDGIHVPDAPEFDAWVARERGRIERLFLETCERRLPVLLRTGEWSAAARLAERWLDASPRSATAFIGLLRAQAGPGTAVALHAALACYDRVRRTLDETYGTRPDASVTAMAERLRKQLAECEWQLTDASKVADSSDDVPVTAVDVPPEVSAPTGAPQSAPPARLMTARRVAWWASATICVLTAGVLIAAVRARRQPTGAADVNGPVVAVAGIEEVGADSSVDWLRAGLPRIIASDLGAMGGVEVVAPARVRDVLVRLTGSSLSRLTEDQATDVARRLGATWVVTGGVSAAKNGYLLDVTMRNVAGHAETQSFTILSANPIDLGTQAAIRLAALLNLSPGNGIPRYSGIETTSPEAYRHFIRGMLAADAEQLATAAREFDSAIALDSGFVVAVRNRRNVARSLGDVDTDRRLAPLEQRFASRLPEFDRLSDEVRNIDSLGEHARANALAEQVLKEFPHDPRAFALRAEVFAGVGQWAAAESILVRELALDSLAIEAGDGPCIPCEVLWPLSQMRLARGDRIGAEQTVRRWVALQPDYPGAWRSLSATLAAVGKSSEAVQAGFHYVALSNESPAVVDFGRTMIAARRPDIADSLVRSWRHSNDPVLVQGALDLQVILMRERGQFAASVAALSKLPITNGLSLVRADGLARLGRLGEARAIFEASGHPPGSAGTGQFTAPEARGFTWSHALEADALARAGDTTTARALVDSLISAGRQSYYARDWLLHHHVSGMLFFAQGKYPDAERELRAAEWTSGAWTRTNVELARAQLAEHHPADAIATLRDASAAPLDGMGRYVPHSELDWWMSRAFAAAGQHDSATVYAGYVRVAWKNADPFVRARLESLPR